MEKALRYELNTIPEIQNSIFPTNAPEGKKPPYLVYILSQDDEVKTLDGFTGNYEVSYLLNILAGSYGQMKDITKKVQDLVKTFQQREIGQEGIFISELKIRKGSETYEHELQLYRGILDVTFWYKE